MPETTPHTPGHSRRHNPTAPMTTLTTDLLTDLLRARWRPDATALAFERGPVGNGQEVWFVEVTTNEGSMPLVIRRTAESGPLDWTDREREFRVLRALDGSGLPTARALFFEPEGGRLGRAAFAMTRLPGSPLRREPAEVRERVVADLGRLLARLHALDPAIAGDAIAGSARQATESELDRWESQYHDRRRGSIPLMGALFAWLRENIPDRDAAPALLWGDPGPHNALHVDSEVTGLLDWELWHLGDPLEDLGGAMWSVEQVADPEVLLAAYEEASGTAVDRAALNWYRVLATLSRGVMLVNGIANVIDGHSHTPSLAGLGLQLLPDTLRQAAATAGWQAAAPEVPSPQTERPNDPSRPRPDATETLELVEAFLTGDVLPATDALVLRRGLKTAVALLATIRLRIAIEHGVSEGRASETEALLGRLADAGVDVTGGLEPTARRVESEPGAAAHRAEIRRHLLADLARHRTLIEPLDTLYG